MSSSIAAAVIIVIGIITSLSPDRAGAADQLKEVAEASRRYQGWVHARMGESEVHMNMADGTSVDVTHPDGRLFVRMYVPPKNQEIVYDGHTNELRIGQTWHEFSKNWAKMMMDYPLTVSDMLAMAKNSGMPEPTVDKFPDNGLERFEINQPNAQKNTPKIAVLWVDPKTRLIHKTQTDGPDGVVIVTFSYGDPVIHDAYDLGVPRTAVVIDMRPPASVEELFARLQKRVDSAFGKIYVALVSETITNDEVKDEPQAITLIARDGEKFLNLRYLLGPDKDVWIGFHQPVPKGWPAPALADVLNAAKVFPPVQGFVANGESTWSFIADDATHKLESQPGGDVRRARRMFDLPPRVWPNRESLGAFGAGSKCEIVTDNAHPRMIGLRLSQKIWTGRGDPDSPRENRHEESVYWLDPSHDDVPTEYLHRANKPGSDQLETEIRTTYSDLKQIPGGTWYASRHRSEVTQRVRAQDNYTHYVQEEIFQIFPVQRVDEAFYSDPAKYSSTRPATSP